MPTPARREISAIDTSASGSANAARATVTILSRLRSASVRLAGDRGWLAGIVTNLVIKSIAVGGHTQVFWDIALRDFGLMLAAFALSRLAVVFAPKRFVPWRTRATNS